MNHFVFVRRFAKDNRTKTIVSPHWSNADESKSDAMRWIERESAWLRAAKWQLVGDRVVEVTMPKLNDAP